MPYNFAKNARELIKSNQIILRINSLRAKLIPIVALAVIVTGCAKKPIPAIQPPPTPPRTAETTLPVSNRIVETTSAHAHFDMHGPMPDPYPR
ncbi:hypothetical protein AA0481_1394 [Acetobacter orientalis NRIC 0481]|uniref:Uncharacterized protein n=1 Tax=Acetobacter orientalis TaxID=146474 RepID=A0A0D6NK31_9PROT|nr:hypothetical protein Abor_014_123 [Acetobacter orientalis]GBR17554.1 hypothetical protein AA0481_1394 [Acetobacter orientalis NRIC 0481]GEL60368.1 hypothetical protein AOR02nite_02100 [Acetobacter orientalis]